MNCQNLVLILNVVQTKRFSTRELGQDFHLTDLSSLTGFNEVIIVPKWNLNKGRTVTLAGLWLDQCRKQERLMNIIEKRLDMQKNA